MHVSDALLRYLHYWRALSFDFIDMDSQSRLLSFLLLLLLLFLSPLTYFGLDQKIKEEMEKVTGSWFCIFMTGLSHPVIE